MRIVFTPWGSLGDLHPYLAVALEMKRRGHDVLIATSDVYREKAEGEGLRFHSVRPDLRQYLEHPEQMADVMDRLRGPEMLFRRILMPAVRDMYDDLIGAVTGADLLVSHVAMCAAPMVAEKLGLRWVSVALQPAVFLSAYDPPYLPVFGNWLRLSPIVARIFTRFIRVETKRWLGAVYQLRQQLGLSTQRKHPLFEGQFSPFGTLAFFSPIFAHPQRDWPEKTVVTGFPFYDKLAPELSRLPEAMEQFLRAGDAPVVFTLGSSAVLVPSDFYAASARVVEKLSIRGILLAGPDFEKRIPIRTTSKLLVVEYAPYSQLFARSAAVVHSGGVGTTAQVLRSGKPMIVVPFSHDQPDNGARISRLGAGVMIPRRKYKPNTVAGELNALLSNTRIAQNAAKIGHAIRQEDGIRGAADALEAISANR
jgi:UDP:flavonoid glycosyltransferase YjiC (YdhE family)